MLKVEMRAVRMKWKENSKNEKKWKNRKLKKEIRRIVKKRIGKKKRWFKKEKEIKERKGNRGMNERPSKKRLVGQCEIHL